MEAWSLLLALAAVILALYHYFGRGLDFFKKRDIPHVPGLPIVGNLAPVLLQRMPMAHLLFKTYNLFPDAKYVGFFDFNNPVVIIRDLELAKTVAVKSFENFLDHRGFGADIRDPLFGKNLFNLRGDPWREARTLLSPAFTSSKMRTMFQLMSSYAVEFASFLSEQTTEIEMRNAFGRYTTDVIATCAFGVNVDSMRHPDNDFYVLGREATFFDFLRTMKLALLRGLPEVQSLGVRMVSKKVERFFKNLVETTIRTRDERGITRPDMIQLMMESRGKSKKELTIDEMTSQAFIFFFGGFDTVSIAMSFAAHELAAHPEIQRRLQVEIDEVLGKNEGELTYEAVNDMEYLSAVVEETLRMYPVAISLDRVCTKSFDLPPALPGGKSVRLEAGNCIWIPIFAFSHDPKYFEDPEIFDPERFLGERRKDVNTAAYFPFGLGPRMCIGNRFALLEVKAMLFHLLARCNLKTCEKTSLPMRLSKTGLAMTAEKGFWLRMERRQNPHASIVAREVKKL